MGNANAAFDTDRTFGMGREGFDNLQAVNLGEISPLPQPKNRPGKGYHPAGQVEIVTFYKLKLVLGNS
jgi:hypothetical protein